MIPQGLQETPQTVLKRVIVVDDNEILLRAWSRMLERQKCTAVVTSDPVKALDLLRENGADVLIADIVMPQMDGIELMQRANEMNPRMRVILTTGYPCDFGRIRLRIDAPDVHVLLKPYNDLKAIQKFIDRVLQNDESLDTEDSFKNPDDIRVHLWNL